jgi:TPR repeat protein
MKTTSDFSFLRVSVFLASASLIFLLAFPGLSFPAHDLPGMAPAPGEYPDVRGIPCGSWMAYLTLTEKCDELEKFFNKWEPLAEQCNPTAQTLIGLKYLQYPQTRKKAAEWFQQAAGQDFGAAQFELAMLYESGSGGVSKDDVKAFLWYSLALKNGEMKAESELKELERSMSAESLAEARKLVGEWQPTPCEKSEPEKEP